MAKIVIIDYGMGNLRSVLRRIQKLHFSAEISSDPKEIEKADKIILPGVGAFKSGMDELKKRGLLDVLNQKALLDKVPVLGICLGMQLIAQKSEEGDAKGLGWIDGEAIRFRFEDQQNTELKIPHIGWNTVAISQPEHPLVCKFNYSPRFYFVHSYHLRIEDADLVVGSTNYGYEFPAIIAKDNIWAAQFHPEKSHQDGVTILKAFLEKAA